MTVQPWTWSPSQYVHASLQAHCIQAKAHIEMHPFPKLSHPSLQNAGGLALGWTVCQTCDVLLVKYSTAFEYHVLSAAPHTEATGRDLNWVYHREKCCITTSWHEIRALWYGLPPQTNSLVNFLFEDMTMVPSALDDSSKRLIPLKSTLIPGWYIPHQVRMLWELVEAHGRQHS